MNRNRFLTLLLAAAFVAQTVIAGWGHSHVHLPTAAHPHHDHAAHSTHSHSSASHSHHHPHAPGLPTDEPDCAVCRHLALAVILNVDLEPTLVGTTVEPVQDQQSCLVSTFAIGLRRPRSPPELS